MTASSADEAVNNARHYGTCDPGMCLKYVRTWLEIGSRDASAAEAWHNAARRHRGDMHPPKGAPVFWTGGSQGYGHIALSVGHGRVRSTDVPSSGRVSEVPISWINQHWGQHFEGWTEDLNGQPITWLIDEPGAAKSRWASGDVYVRKLHEGQHNSDSVSRLCYRLVTHTKMPGTHRPARMYRWYGEDMKEAVRFWQRNIARKGTKGPTDGSYMSNPQAKQLFGPNYEVHPK